MRGAGLLHEVLLTVFLLSGRGFSLCYITTNCTGSTITAGSQRECCVDTEDGLSFSSDGNCSPCIGA